MSALYLNELDNSIKLLFNRKWCDQQRWEFEELKLSQPLNLQVEHRKLCDQRQWEFEELILSQLLSLQEQEEQPQVSFS